MNLLKEFDVKSSNYSTACEYINVKQHDDDLDKDASEYDNLSRGAEPPLASVADYSSKMVEPVANAPKEEHEKHPKMDLKGDRGSIVLLIFLYLLQGNCSVFLINPVSSCPNVIGSGRYSDRSVHEHPAYIELTPRVLLGPGHVQLCPLALFYQTLVGALGRRYVYHQDRPVQYRSPQDLARANTVSYRSFHVYFCQLRSGHARLQAQLDVRLV